MSTSQQGEAERLYRAGASVQWIADRMGASYNCVRQHLVRAGVPRRPRGGRH
ncbi:helix-turn-helix domain-containing protein [Rathayibacter sp. SD072]|uniref:helix-turn-helix domain-containing protein n=1 Tax=Rathayibacter sp. SD072 TaxID=2781731 RepID=UPI0035A88334